MILLYLCEPMAGGLGGVKAGGGGDDNEDDECDGVEVADVCDDESDALYRSTHEMSPDDPTAPLEPTVREVAVRREELGETAPQDMAESAQVRSVVADSTTELDDIEAELRQKALATLRRYSPSLRPPIGPHWPPRPSHHEACEC